MLLSLRTQNQFTAPMLSIFTNAYTSSSRGNWNPLLAFRVPTHMYISIFKYIWLKSKNRFSECGVVLFIQSWKGLNGNAGVQINSEWNNWRANLWIEHLLPICFLLWLPNVWPLIGSLIFPRLIFLIVTTMTKKCHQLLMVDSKSEI